MRLLKYFSNPLVPAAVRQPSKKEPSLKKKKKGVGGNIVTRKVSSKHRPLCTRKGKFLLQNTHFHTKDILQNHLITPPSADYNGKWDQLVGLEIFALMGKKVKGHIASQQLVLQMAKDYDSLCFHQCLKKQERNRTGVFISRKCNRVSAAASS